ncbi:FAD-dependent oxidoreductase [Embleya sp. AB8]|uniref:FAD-dependent oxidoreductase n=1 Tax=Embleya sp. AB8 TaxID=3156304 RepID=UPI003C73A2B1
MRTVIVGGGVVGLLTALECVRAGHHVTVVEQGSLPNPNAASHEPHRVLRALHPEDPGATGAAVAAHHAWLELETRLRVRCYHRVGALTVLPADRVAAARSVLAAAGGSGGSLGPDSLARRYRHLRFPAGHGAVFEERAGVLLADRVLAAAVRRLRAGPRTQLLAHTTVTAVNVAERAVTLANGRVLRGDRLLVAAGAWTRPLLPAECARRLTVHRQTVLYCDVPHRDRETWARSPAMPALGGAGGAWLVPPVAGTPLEISAHEVTRVVAGVAGHRAAPLWVRALHERFAELIPGFHRGWVVDARDCYYVSDAATGGPLLLDLADGEVFADAASAGGSFKFAPLTARALATRLTGVAPPPTGLRHLDRPVRVDVPDVVAHPTDRGANPR